MTPVVKCICITFLAVEKQHHSTALVLSNNCSEMTAGYLKKILWRGDRPNLKNEHSCATTRKEKSLHSLNTKSGNKAESSASRHWLANSKTRQTRSKKRSDSQRRPSNSAVAKKSWIFLQTSCTNGLEIFVHAWGFSIIVLNRSVSICSAL